MPQVASSPVSGTQTQTHQLPSLCFQQLLTPPPHLQRRKLRPRKFREFFRLTQLRSGLAGLLAPRPMLTSTILCLVTGATQRHQLPKKGSARRARFSVRTEDAPLCWPAEEGGLTSKRGFAELPLPPAPAGQCAMPSLQAPGACKSLGLGGGGAVRLDFES